MSAPDLSEFYAEHRSNGVPKVRKVTQFLDKLPDDKRELAVQALDAPDVKDPWIMRVFRNWGKELGISDKEIPATVTIHNYRVEVLGHGDS